MENLSFTEMIKELDRRFEEEKSIKNRLYSFIISKGLSKELHEYEPEK